MTGVPPIQPIVAVDAVLVERGKLLVVIRRHEPFRGRPALPGGRVEFGETVEAALYREVLEETGLEVRIDALVGVYADPGRDPRGHTIAIAYEVSRVGGSLRAGTDAADTAWIAVEPLPHLAFDHTRIVGDALRAHRR